MFQGASSLFLSAFLASLAMPACARDASEADLTQTRYEIEVPSTLAKGGAIVEVAGGVMAVVGTRLVYVPSSPGGASVVVQEAPRLHDALATDDNYVYYATQKAERVGFFFPRSETGPAKEPDGAIYRVPKKPPFAPEALAPVGILTGRFASVEGHIYVCESPGSNGEGQLVDLPVAAPATTKHRPFRFNEYCVGVVADKTDLYLLMDRSKRTDGSSEQTLVLSTASRSADQPWEQTRGPTVLRVTDAKQVRAFYPHMDDLALVAGTDATLFTKTGAPNGAFRAGTLGLLVPDSGVWYWSKDSDRAADLGRTCQNGRLAVGATVAGAAELTQDVCAVDALARASSGIWFLEHAEIYAPNGRDTLRYRLKLVPARAL